MDILQFIHFPVDEYLDFVVFMLYFLLEKYLGEKLLSLGVYI